MYGPSNMYGPSAMPARSPAITYVQRPSLYLPMPVTAHVKPNSSHSSCSSDCSGHEKHHVSTSARQYHYAITDTPTRSWTSCFSSAYVGVPLVEVLTAALQTLFCFLYLIAGHAILHSTHLNGYSASISSSVKVGAMGGAAMTLPALLLCVYRRDGPVFALWSILVDTLIGAIAGPIGVLILTNHLHEQMLDPLHAARAGALGAVIISAGLHLLRKLSS